MSIHEIGFFPEIDHKNIRTQNLTQHLLKEKFQSNFPDKRITLSVISYDSFLHGYGNHSGQCEKLFAGFHSLDGFNSNLKDLQESITEMEPVKDGKVSLRLLSQRLCEHYGQLEEDVVFDGTENVNETIERIKIIQSWIGTNNLQTLKKIGLFGEELTLDKEIQYILNALHADFENTIDQLNDSQYYSHFDYKGKEIEEGYGPIFESQYLEDVVELSETSAELRKIKNQLNGFIY